MTLPLSTRPRDVLDVSRLPTYAFGSRSVISWGTLGFMVIEGALFVLLIVSYFYLRSRSPQWPLGAHPPALFWGTLNLAFLLVSSIPNQLAKRAAERLDLKAVRLWMSVCLVFGIAFIWIRVYEFRALNVWWDYNAYGSLVWVLLGFHTVHLLTDEVDSAVLAAVMFIGPLEESRFVDVSENSLYWYFVLGSWVPIYAVIYVAPRI
jgi:heme/copper-type cytochrome/quinol oxidase subunit 3